MKQVSTLRKQKPTKSRHELIDDALQLADTPVNPNVFTKKVTSFLKSVGVTVSDESPKVIERLCMLFNYSIGNPKIGGLLNSKNILIYPAQTGIGKSVSIQHYVSMLSEESSLIVVRTIEEAKDYCIKINSLRQQSNYAQFLASRDTKHEFQLEGVKLLNLAGTQCLVITHNMFKSLLHGDDTPIRLYVPLEDSNPTPRNLIVIDERLQFLTKRFLKFNKIESIEKFIQNAISHSPSFKSNKEFIKHQKTIKILLDIINEEHRDGRASHIDRLTIESRLEKQELPIRVDFNAICNAAAARLDEINEEVSLLKISGISNIRDIKNEVVSTFNSFINVTRLLSPEENVTHTGGEEVFGEFAIYEKDLYFVKNLYSRFGTTVVLDATAEVNSFYKISSNSNSHIDIVAAPKIRKYNNLKIYKAQGHRQSAKAIVASDKENFEKITEFYKKVIEEILDDGDKLLVITFDKFANSNWLCLDDVFMGRKDQVEVINWGKHIGRNQWSSFNKVILIGWLRLPKEESVSKLLNISSLGSADIRTMKYVTPKKLRDLQYSEVADDLIQGAMRCCARVIGTADSDCKPASVYLFQDTLEGSDEVIRLFEGEFPGATIVDWKIKTKTPKALLSGPDQKKEEAIEHLVTLSASQDSYSRSQFCKEFGIPASSLSRWLKEGYFKDRLEELGFKLEKPQGKPERFYFK